MTVHTTGDKRMHIRQKNTNLLNTATQIVQGPLLVDMQQHHESIALAGHVLFGLQEVAHQLRGIRDQELEVTVDREDGKHGVAAHVRVAKTTYIAYQSFRSSCNELRIQHVEGSRSEYA